MKCPHCEREYTESADRNTCPFCGNAPEPEKKNADHDMANESVAAEPGSPSPRSEYCPWEDQEHIGFWEGMVQTVKLSVFSPRQFFATLPRQGSLFVPLLYGLILEMLGSIVNFLWSVVLGSTVPVMLSASGGSAVLLGLLVPLLVFISIIVWAVVLHVSLFLVGGAREDFEATFRVVCYASGVEIFNALPVIGGIVKLFWKIYLTVVGLREVQGITTARAATAVFLPAIFCCAIPLVGIVAVLIATL
ncbi:MAG TPA: YIP1 family protein [Desulfomonilaceae bacterium]|nr:YIP1 family protein [Desulfomonilaceae bacterium]